MVEPQLHINISHSNIHYSLRYASNNPFCSYFIYLCGVVCVSCLTVCSGFHFDLFIVFVCDIEEKAKLSNRVAISLFLWRSFSAANSCFELISRSIFCFRENQSSSQETFLFQFIGYRIFFLCVIFHFSPEFRWHFKHMTLMQKSLLHFSQKQIKAENNRAISSNTSFVVDFQ